MTDKECVELQKLIVRHASELFPKDSSSPCIVVSFLSQQRGYYFAVKRFKSSFGRGAHVVVSTISPGFHEGIHALAHTYAEWVEQHIAEEPADRIYRGKITRIYNILKKEKQDE